MVKKQKKQRFLDKLQNKYRLVILNDDTFEERASFRLSRFNVYMLFATLVVILMIFTVASIVFTPLKEYIPGYGDVDMRKELFLMKQRADSLEVMVYQQDKWITNVQKVLTGQVDADAEVEITNEEGYDSLDLESIPDADLALRAELENEENFSLTVYNSDRNVLESVTTLELFPPVKGFVTQKYNAAKEHLGVDIVAPENEPIRSVLPGTVILADWTLETGHVIAIQHDGEIVSFYKHNSALLKKVGNFVNAGDAIAVIGNTGELTDGPHLHFELWHKQKAVDPEDHIMF